MFNCRTGTPFLLRDYDNMEKRKNLKRRLQIAKLMGRPIGTSVPFCLSIAEVKEMKKTKLLLECSLGFVLLKTVLTRAD